MKVTEIIFLTTKEARLVVKIPAAGPYLTSEVPWLPRSVFKLFPHIAAQRCHNDKGHSFLREAQGTEIPHLFEHIIIEIQNQVHRGIGVRLRGQTEWNWTVDPRGIFYVTVNYDNEVVALGAIRLAERIVNALDSRCIDSIDMPREIARLRELAKLTRRRHAPPAASPRHLDAPLLPADTAA